MFDLDEEGNRWINGDGGPIIILQGSAVPLWQGSNDWDNSLMGGGTVETDYDVICDCEEGVSILHRYDRDMLVLDDSEAGAAFISSALGEVVILQPFGFDNGATKLVEQVTTAPPAYQFPFVVEDTTLRLFVGADAGSDANFDEGGYGYSEVTVTLGPKLCTVYASEGAQVIVLQPAPSEA